MCDDPRVDTCHVSMSPSKGIFVCRQEFLQMKLEFFWECLSHMHGTFGTAKINAKCLQVFYKPYLLNLNLVIFYVVDDESFF